MKPLKGHICWAHRLEYHRGTKLCKKSQDTSVFTESKAVPQWKSYHGKIRNHIYMFMFLENRNRSVKYLVAKSQMLKYNLLSNSVKMRLIFSILSDMS